MSVWQTKSANAWSKLKDKTRCKICSNLAIIASEQKYWMSLLLILNRFHTLLRCFNVFFSLVTNTFIFEHLHFEYVLYIFEHLPKIKCDIVNKITVPINHRKSKISNKTWKKMKLQMALKNVSQRAHNKAFSMLFYISWWFKWHHI